LELEGLKRIYNITQWDAYKLNFWGISKCANTAVKVALCEKKYGAKMRYSKVKWVHNPKNVMYITPEMAKNNNYFNFTVTRNPYTRFISMYKDVGLRRPLVNIRHIEELSIDTFLDAVEEMFELPEKTMDPHVRTQTSWIFEDNICLVNKVMDIKAVHSFLQKYNLKFEMVNVIESDPIQLTQKQRKRIYKLYKEDFIKLGYIK